MSEIESMHLSSIFGDMLCHGKKRFCARSPIKKCRRVATRYDKLAANYLAFVKLASIRIWLRANESAS
jgi:hypothetical protein